MKGIKISFDCHKLTVDCSFVCKKSSRMEGGERRVAAKVKSLTQIHFHKVFTQISIAHSNKKLLPLLRPLFAEEIFRIKICMSSSSSLSLAAHTAFILRVLFYVILARSQYTPSSSYLILTYSSQEVKRAARIIPRLLLLLCLLIHTSQCLLSWV